MTQGIDAEGQEEEPTLMASMERQGTESSTLTALTPDEQPSHNREKCTENTKVKHSIPKSVVVKTEPMGYPSVSPKDISSVAVVTTGEEPILDGSVDQDEVCSWTVNDGVLRPCTDPEKDDGSDTVIKVQDVSSVEVKQEVCVLEGSHEDMQEQLCEPAKKKRGPGRPRKYNQVHRCETCLKTFSFKKNCNLKVHKMIHSGEKEYRCRLCQKAFSTNSAMRNHQRVHYEDKPYVCEVCHKTFKLSSTLYHHRQTHFMDRVYQCEVCNKTFSSSSNLYHHRSVHTGEKPFQCQICLKPFRQKCNMQEHMRTHGSLQGRTSQEEMETDEPDSGTEQTDS